MAMVQNKYKQSGTSVVKTQKFNICLHYYYIITF